MKHWMTIHRQKGWCDLDRIMDWSNIEIVEFYEDRPNLSLLTYAGVLGLTGGEVEKILNGEAMAEEMGMYCTPYDPQEDM